MEYKGFSGTAEYYADAGVWYGEVAGIRDVVTFEARTEAEVESAFRASVDAYLNMCGVPPSEAGEGTELRAVEKMLACLDLAADEDLIRDAGQFDLDGDEFMALRDVLRRIQPKSAIPLPGGGDPPRTYTTIRAFGPGVYEDDQLHLPAEDRHSVVVVRLADVDWLMGVLRDFRDDCAEHGLRSPASASAEPPTHQHDKQSHDVRYFVHALAEAAEITGTRNGLDVKLLGAMHLLNWYAEKARAASAAGAGTPETSKGVQT